MRNTKALLAVVALLFGASAAQGQSFSLALRGGGGIPLGAFASSSAGQSDQALLTGAKSGFGYGLDAGLSMGALGLYAGFDHMQFDCQDTQCGSNGNYTLGGVSAGLRMNLMPRAPVHPWVKGGITFDNLKGAYGSGGSSNLTTDRAPGYEVAAGLDVPLLGVLALSPQVRYVGQNAKFKVPGVNVTSSTQQTLTYLKLELGLGFAPGLRKGMGH